MKHCKCGSLALNIDKEVCDVCYYKNKFEVAVEAFKDIRDNSDCMSGDPSKWSYTKSVKALQDIEGGSDGQ